MEFGEFRPDVTWDIAELKQEVANADDDGDDVTDETPAETAETKPQSQLKRMAGLPGHIAEESLEADVSRVVQPIDSPEFISEQTPSHLSSTNDPEDASERRVYSLSSGSTASRRGAVPAHTAVRAWLSALDGRRDPATREDAERFTCDAFTPSTREEAAEQPYVDNPGMLAVLTTLGAVCIMDHPKLRGYAPA